MQRAFDATMKRNRHKSIRWEKTSLSKVQNGKFNRMLVYNKVASVFGMDIKQQSLNILNIGWRYRRRSLSYTQLIIAHISVVVHHLLFMYLCLFIIYQWTTHRGRRRSKRDRASLDAGKSHNHCINHFVYNNTRELCVYVFFVASTSITMDCVVYAALSFQMNRCFQMVLIHFRHQ